ncbi:PIN domain-containing protein [Nocardia zapadnayensis]|uniref:PIN domain-containing protein n=1 Tax=Nocardia rhamnosiphila TaxID=426716 RepID=UPI0022459429|nr:PIN domain-containing protein [Nocardia zapadnayensis]MCX0270880.1 PIN domain-containing protein [Nocardia zapadnayensis]
MGRRLILDTGVLIAYERGTIDRTAYDDDDLAIAAVTVAEFRVGIELAGTAERAAQRSRRLALLLADLDILEYTDATATRHAQLLAQVRRSGRPRGAHDLIIAAHAAETGRAVVSLDTKAKFGDLDGVTAITP